MVAQASAPRISRRHRQLRVARHKQHMRNVRRLLRQSILAEAVILSVLISFLLAPQLVLRAQDDATHGMHDGMSMPMDSPLDAATQAALQAWKRESEFNPHLAGFLVLVAGLLILPHARIRHPSAAVRHILPL